MARTARPDPPVGLETPVDLASVMCTQVYFVLPSGADIASIDAMTEQRKVGHGLSPLGPYTDRKTMSPDEFATSALQDGVLNIVERPRAPPIVRRHGPRRRRSRVR